MPCFYAYCGPQCAGVCYPGTPPARPEFIEFKGEGLKHLESAIKEKELQIGALDRLPLKCRTCDDDRMEGYMHCFSCHHRN